MANRRFSYIGPESVKFDGLVESTKAWQALSSDPNQSVMTWSDFVKICTSEINQLNNKKAKVPPKLVQQLISTLSIISDTMLAQAESFTKADSANILTELSDQLIPLFQLLKFLVFKKEIKLKKREASLIIDFCKKIKNLFWEDLEPESINELINIIKLQIEILCIAKSYWKKTSTQLHSTFNFFFLLLSDFIASQKLRTLGLFPYEIDKTTRKIMKDKCFSYHLDLLTFVLFTISSYYEINAPFFAVDEFSTLVPILFNYILHIDDFKKCKNSLSSELALQKALFSIEILSACSHISKIDHGKIVIENEEKLKETFFYFVLNYMKNFFSANSQSFENEKGYLGSLYRSLFELIRNSIDSSEITSNSIISSCLEGLPIVLFSLYWQTDIAIEMKNHPPQLQTYTLQFLKKYLENLGISKFQSKLLLIKDFGLVSLIFSKPFFQIEYPINDDTIKLSEAASQSWNGLWNDLIGNPMNLEWISQSIVSHMRQNQDDVEYIIHMNSWIQGQFLEKGKEKFMEIGIKNGIIEQILSIVISLSSKQDSYDQMTVLFCILKLILEKYYQEDLPGGDTLIDLMLQDKLLKNSSTVDICASFISRVLKFDSEKAYERFEWYLNAATDIDVLLQLLTILQEVLKDLEDPEVKRRQACFTKSNAIRVLKIKLINDYSKEPAEKVSDLWGKTFECIRFLLYKNPESKKAIKEFDFDFITNTVMRSAYDGVRKEICLKSIESLFCILLDTKIHGRKSGLHIKTPEVIPLIIELLFDIDYSNDSARIMDDNIEFIIQYDADRAHLAARRTIDIILYTLEKNSENSNLNYIEDVLSKIICHHITPQELRRIINIVQSSKNFQEKKLMIYRSLYRSIEHAFSRISQTGENRLGLSPTRYFYFRDPESMLACKNDEKLSFLPRKEFSLFVWLFPDSIENSSCLFEFFDRHGNKLSFMMKHQGILHLKNGARFKAWSNKRVIENQWNLVGFTIRQGAKCDFIINNSFCIEGFEGKVSYPTEYLNKFLCGNNKNSKKPFNGKMSTIYIVNKLLQEKHVLQIYSFSFQYKLGFNLEAISTSENFDGNSLVIKEIWQSLWLKWDPRSYNPEFSPTNKLIIEERCERFNGVTILEAITANGGLNIFLPLIKECSNSEEVILIINMIGVICQTQTLDSLITAEFLDLLGIMMEDIINNPSEDLLEAVKLIIKNLDWNEAYQIQAIKSLLLGKLWNKLSQDHQEKYISALSMYIPKYFRCNLKTIVPIYDHISRLEISPQYRENFSEKCKEILSMHLPNEIGAEHIDGLFGLIFNMKKDEKWDFLCNLLIILNDKKISRDCLIETCNLMLYIMSDVKVIAIKFRAFSVFLRCIESLDLRIINSLTTQLNEALEKEDIESFKKDFYWVWFIPRFRYELREKLASTFEGLKTSDIPASILDINSNHDWEKMIYEALECDMGTYIQLMLGFNKFYSLDMLAVIFIAETIELVKKTDDKMALEFLKAFIESVQAWNIIKHLENYRYFKEQINLENLEVGKIAEIENLAAWKNPSQENYQAACIEISNLIKNSLESQEKFIFLINSSELLNGISFLLLVLMGNKYSSIKHQSVDSPTRQEKRGLKDFIKEAEDIQKELRKQQAIIEKYFERNKLLLKKKYQKFTKKIQETSGSKKVYKIRSNFDKMGRMPFLSTVKEKPQDSSALNSAFQTFSNRFSMQISELVRSYSILLKEDTERLIKATSDDTSYAPSIAETEETEEIFNEISDEDWDILEEDNNTPSVNFDCERIKIAGSYWGNLEISSAWLLFSSKGELKPNNEEYFGSALDHTRRKKKCKKIWRVDEIAEVLPRRFIHRHTAIEVFFKSGKSCLFNLFSAENRNSCLQEMKIWDKHNVHVVEKIDQEYVLKYTKAWKNGKLSNFEYLMILNKLASRSFNDINQYPVFPWIIKEFSTSELFLNHKEIYRDLRFPIGAQDDNTRKEVSEKYKMWQSEEIMPFHYGSHYSNAGVVFYYLVRLHPFTEGAKELQGGKFDIADRLFHSIEISWDCAQSPSGDVKELIPEMFYLPEMLLNVNNLDLGTRQCGKGEISHVELPLWAKTGARTRSGVENLDYYYAVNFIRKHRKALESDFVSENLHNWIDLIFGYKQQGPAAESALNIFFYSTYEENMQVFKEKNQSFLQSTIQQVVHFGQTPVQLFKLHHPQKDIHKRQRTIFQQKITEKTDNQGTRTRKIFGKIFALFTTSSWLIGVKSSGNNSLSGFRLSFKRELGEMKLDSTSYQEFILEATTEFGLENWVEESLWKHTFNNEDPRIILDKNPNQYCLLGEKYIVSGFHIENSFKVHNLKGILIQSIHHHAGLVTCVASIDDLLFTGSLDASICLWLHIGEKQKIIKPRRIYLGHSSVIRQISASPSYQVLVSLSSNGLILMHDIRSGDCLKSFPQVSQSLPRAVAISELGIIAAAISEENLIVVYSLNGEVIRCLEVKRDLIWCIQFDASGEFLISGGTESIGFVGVFDEDKKVYREVQSTVMAICLPKGQEFIIYAMNKEEAQLCIFDLTPKQKRHTMPPHMVHS
ncbi:NBEAL1_1 [Blepharisma stoltei]|uniref:Uncharacterized protein n=1 Tax=Blepharisma stoltei TaxID=1481888 RepID=A0AAU9KEJ9_9CILI|nr:unnamed protein product [Blepharisma stoltei]